ncbi:TIGR04222 domain-containing membrane protein [Amycolatopsis jejuensis]|uniref:TIGR04222 domain-containing membrane protein n=1 Tax=Amycolatopsis jejuensis TaxID=330084 RepID=UPI0005264754|nr:TIGR04222 domain-containing membrane protein [Amycolatopsis jejuensis]
MEQPWGLSGPQFLLIYGPALALVVIVQLAWPPIARAVRKQPPADVRSPLDVYQLAYLAGGPHRTVDAAIASLLERGLLRVSTKGQLTAIAAGSPAGWVESAVHEACRGTAQTTAQLRKSGSVAPAVQAIGRDLEGRGLTLPSSMFNRFYTRLVLVYVALFAVGLIRSINGGTLHRPNEFLNGLLIATAMLAMFTLILRGNTKTRPTRAGRGIVAYARTDTKARKAYGGVAFVGAASLVALGGIALYPDHATSAALKSGAGSSSGGDGGGDGGGSGCGGGGCGG